MFNRNLILFFFSIFFVSSVMFAGNADTVFVRLKSGAKTKGIIISAKIESFTLNIPGLGEEEFKWNEIAFMSSAAVYDSLRNEKSIIVLPAPSNKQTLLGRIWSAEFLFGHNFDNEMGVALGVRGKFRLLKNFSLGAASLLYMGEFEKFHISAPAFYLGAEAAFPLVYKYLVFEPALGIGETSFFNKTNDNSNSSNKYESGFTFVPSFGLKANLGYTEAGIQYRYTTLGGTNFSSLFFTAGF